MPGALDIDTHVRKAAAGDRSALEHLLLHYQADLFASIRRKIGRRHAGALISPEDVLQETWAAAARSITTLEARGGDAFLAWLKAIARSRLLNLLEATRAKKRGGGPAARGGKRATTGAAAGSMDPGTVNALVERLAAGTDRPSVVIRKREAIARTEQALAAVNPSHRNLIDLHLGRGLTHAQVAREVGSSEGAVKMAIQRALASIRRRLEGPGA